MYTIDDILYSSIGDMNKGLGCKGCMIHRKQQFTAKSASLFSLQMEKVQSISTVFAFYVLAYLLLFRTES